MDFSTDTIHRRVINPVLDSSFKFSQSTQVNMWPVRQQSFCKRFYGNCKLKSNFSYNQPNVKNEIIPVTMKLDIEDFDKQKSYMSMAFCSTSKVKYMPLPGSSCDQLSGVKLGSQHTTFFPTLSRPTSKPVLLHGKRYTVITPEFNRSKTALVNTNDDDYSVSSKHDCFSEQRKRFNEKEHSKFNVRSLGNSEEVFKSPLRKGYLLSGHQMRLRSSKSMTIERPVRLQPTISLHSQKNWANNVENLSSSHHADHTDNLSNFLVSNQNQILPDSTLQHNTSICSFNEDDKEVPPEEVIQSIQKVNYYHQNTIIDNETLMENKNCIINIVENILNEYSQLSSSNLFDLTDIESCWDLLQPILSEERKSNLFEITVPMNTEKGRTIFRHAESESIKGSAFIGMLFNSIDESYNTHFWSKIFEDLNIESINESTFCNLISMKYHLHYGSEFYKENLFEDENLSLLKLSFWISFFKTIKYISDMKIEEWMKKSTMIIVNTNAITEELEEIFDQQLKEFIMKHFNEGVSSVSVLDCTITIPWLFETHNKLFQRPFTIDETAKIYHLFGSANDC